MTWKHDWCQPFLDALAASGNVRRSAQEADISHTRAYDFRRENEEFAEAWDEAEEAAVRTVLTPEAVRRAAEGVEEPVFYKGQQVGAVRKYSDTLLIFLLKTHAPDRYNAPQKQEHSGPGGGPIETEQAVHIYLPSNGRESSRREASTSEANASKGEADCGNG